MTEANLTYTDLQTRFTDQSSAHNETVLAAALRAMNDCQNEVLCKGQLALGGGAYVRTGLLPFMRVSGGSISIAASAVVGSLPADFDAMGTLFDETNNKTLIRQDRHLWRKYDPDKSDVTSNVGELYDYIGSDQIEMNKIASSALTLTIDYYKIPTAMASGNTTSDLPNKFRTRILVSYALERYFRGRNDNQANIYLNKYRQGVVDLYDAYKTADKSEDPGFTFDGDERIELIY